MKKLLKPWMLAMLLVPGIGSAAIVQDAGDAWKATAALKNGTLYLTVDPAGAPDWICTPDRFHVVAGHVVTADIGFCEELTSLATFQVLGNFDPNVATHVIWNGTSIPVVNENKQPKYPFFKGNKVPK